MRRSGPGEVELYLLRHAHAGDPARWSGPDDERPLSAKGRAQAGRLGSLLRAVGFAPDMVVTSPRLRSSQTADLVAAALGQKVRLEPRLAAPLGLAELERLLDELGSPRRPLLVGHDPDFSGLVTALVGGAEITLRKGALARLDATRPLAPGGGALRWLLPPELLGRD